MSELSERIKEYTDAVRDHGAGSPEVCKIVDENAQIRELLEFSEALSGLKRQLLGGRNCDRLSRLILEEAEKSPLVCVEPASYVRVRKLLQFGDAFFDPADVVAVRVCGVNPFFVEVRLQGNVRIEVNESEDLDYEAAIVQAELFAERVNAALGPPPPVVPAPYDNRPFENTPV